MRPHFPHQTAECDARDTGNDKFPCAFEAYSLHHLQPKSWKDEIDKTF